EERGYLLTGDAAHLAPYTAARSALAVEVAQLRALTADEATQQHHISRLRLLIAERLTELQQTIDLRRQRRITAAIAVLRSAKSQQTITSLRALLVEMNGVEERLLDDRRRAVSGNWTRAAVPMMPATVADLLLLGALFVFLRGAFAARERHLRWEREVRAQAEAAIVLREQFLSVASHELRTPVTTLLSHVQFLELRLSRIVALGERGRQSFAAIQRQLTRLQALIATMLDVSRIERGQLSISQDLIDFTDLVRTVVDEVQPTTQAHTIYLVLPPPDTILVRCDAMRLSQVLLNRLEDASKSRPDGGPIRVELNRTDVVWVSLAITDCGVGISPDELPHLFERFYRAPMVRSEHISGMGIGLYVVREI